MRFMMLMYPDKRAEEGVLQKAADNPTVRAQVEKRKG